MEGMVLFGNKRSYSDFKKQIPSLVQPLYDSVREFCLSFGENVEYIIMQSCFWKVNDL